MKKMKKWVGDENRESDTKRVDDGVRFFLMLGRFEAFGEPVGVGRALHNADSLTYQQAVDIYRELANIIR